MFDFFSHRSTSAQQAVFFVPQADPFENPLVETDPEQLRQWATALPFANQQQLAESVITSLGRLNRFPGQVKKREALMEIYSTPSIRLSHGLAQRKGQAPISLIRRVMTEMAYGYCHIANECIGNKPNRKNLERLNRAIYYALKYFLLEFLLACEDFDCRSITAYREISRLRTYAEEQKLHLNQIDDPDQPDPEQATIEHQFNRFMLLTLLDPCHLQEGEPRLCFDYLNTLAGEVRIVPPIANTEPTGHYVIDRLGEVPPYLYDPDCRDNLAQPRFTLFDLNPVSQRLHHQLRRMERAEERKPDQIAGLTTQEATNLLARMLRTWHIRLKRDSERHNTSGQVMLWVGIKHVHSYLMGEQITPEHQEQEQEITMSQPAGIHNVGDNDTTSQLTGQRSNQSRSGVALRIAKQSTKLPLVGEVVLISNHRKREGNDWKIGIVKRALNCRNDQLEIGLQFILGKIEPIILRSMNQQQSEEETVDRPGIFIDQGHTHHSSLIVPKHFFVIGQEYRVEEMIPAPSVIPLQLLETTTRFERYRIKGV
ncbi:MAG: flavoprotein [Candidatus Thiodiazotropha sp. (ex Dulcina madagascariensis)]|nr:flavoprotein [Candidatus Thiodiazotropha sp. (ex Dulcina madagascariensis)]MCU7925965.1 flavoprotein [Candidatus Thiodiazotropha sp. (ex Dulcina madagascariensis)]